MMFMAKITLGHACFQMECDGQVFLFDPHGGGIAGGHACGFIINSQ
jgi:L-ascorbate metabolism protein UlaG (beta-lactamase superfamily)